MLLIALTVTKTNEFMSFPILSNPSVELNPSIAESQNGVETYTRLLSSSSTIEPFTRTFNLAPFLSIKPCISYLKRSEKVEFMNVLGHTTDLGGNSAYHRFSMQFRRVFVELTVDLFIPSSMSDIAPYLPDLYMYTSFGLVTSFSVFGLYSGSVV